MSSAGGIVGGGSSVEGEGLHSLVGGCWLSENISSEEGEGEGEGVGVGELECRWVVRLEGADLRRGMEGLVLVGLVGLEAGRGGLKVGGLRFGMGLVGWGGMVFVVGKVGRRGVDEVSDFQTYIRD